MFFIDRKKKQEKKNIKNKKITKTKPTYKQKGRNIHHENKNKKNKPKMKATWV